MSLNTVKAKINFPHALAPSKMGTVRRVLRGSASTNLMSSYA